MAYEACLSRAMAELRQARHLVEDELRAYPTPVSGCDVQYNHLIGLRGSIGEAMEALKAPQFVATPRIQEPGAGVESR